MRPVRIISGGQTGADQAGLEAAVILGIDTGGWAPKGWKTEAGPAPWLKDLGLEQFGTGNYGERTYANVRDSDGTVLFGDPNSAGSLCTLRAIKAYSKPFLINPDALRLRNWAELTEVWILNIAGNRASVNPDLGDIVRNTIVEAFADVC